MVSNVNVIKSDTKNYKHANNKMLMVYKIRILMNLRMEEDEDIAWGTTNRNCVRSHYRHAG